MQTSGTVLLNARGTNIHGYDCFVNLSKDTKNENIISTFYYEATSDYDAFPSIPSTLGCGVGYTKFSNTSMLLKNCISAGIDFDALANNTSQNFTISCWIHPQILDVITPSNKKYTYRGMFFVQYHVIALDIKNTNNNYTNSVNWNKLGYGGWVSTPVNIDLTNRWLHYAMTRYNGTTRLFIDGVKISEITGSGNLFSTGLWLRGYAGIHYYDDLVVIADQALWTSDFTPPSTYLLDREYAIDLNDVKRRNIIAANVDKKLIIPDEDTLKQY